eukprot:CAMPEP_0181302728 /NCGR_PEP_ID=MMETSP1101-20121128/8158_1 /TAXON_ID=46948 /ORGANISM="Rhodomonas abbreviata, Strain Caron Lab Isolate" /LENGTH=1569 /DNA_ID=CAMNT_0023408211 /DNA_START=111 /DNA_END=4820 /DNA_ORIENTATION=-
MNTTVEQPGPEEGWGFDAEPTSFKDFIATPCMFALLSLLLVYRMKRIIWSPHSRETELSQTSTSMSVRVQFFLAALLVLHAAGTLLLGGHYQTGQMLVGVLQLLFWIGCLVVMVTEAKKGLRRSPELKLCWILATLFKIPGLRKAILNFAEERPDSARAFAREAVCALLTLGIATAGLAQATSVSKDVSETSYGQMLEEDLDSTKALKRSIQKPSWASIATFSWINKILATAYGGRICEDELRPLEAEELSSVGRDKVLAAWKGQCRRSPEDPKLWKALTSVYIVDFLKAAILRLVSQGFELMGPLLLQQLLQSIESSGEDAGSHEGESRGFGIVRVDGVMLAVAIGLSKMIGTIVHEQWVVKFVTTNHQVRGSLTGMIFRKAFILSAKGRQGYNIGELISLMSVDANRLGHSMHGLHMLWSAPLMMIVSTALVYSLVGWSVFAGLSVMVILSPINWWVAKRQSQLNKEVMKVKDERSNLMDEVLQGIRIIKYFTWEQNFEDKVREIRKRELSLIWRIGLCTTYIISMWGTTAMLVALVTFAVYTWDGTELTPSVAFGALGLFKVMEHPMSVLGHLIDMVVEAKTALGRLTDFFQADERDSCFYENSCDNAENDDSVNLVRTHREGKAIEITDGVFSWPRYDEKEEDEQEGNGSSRSLLSSFSTLFQSSRSVGMKELNKEPEMEVVLENIKLEVKPGELCMVTGKVGAGKTSLLSAILGEMHKDEGTVILSGKVSYAAQQPWIFNASVRENILFGSALEEDRYAKVLEVCALEQDIRILPAGDQTEIGEKGVNLSGGQKARISLARAVYQRADVYLLDDPLSAVDVHVSKIMFHDCIQKFLVGTTRVLVTHQVQYISGADSVVHVQDRTITSRGSPETVLAQEPHLAGAATPFQNDKSDVEASDPRRGSEDSCAETDTKASDAASEEGDDSNKKLPKDGVQTTEEEVLEGSVDVKIWKQYAKTLGACTITVVMVVTLINQMLAVAVGWWLSVWSQSADSLDTDAEDATTSTGDDAQGASGSSPVFYIAVFAGINVAKALALATLILIERFGGLKASALLHNKMLATVLRLPVEFFDTTPTGRILNRFSSDVHQLDRDVAPRLNSFVGRSVEAIMLCTVIAIMNPWVLVIAIPTMGMFVSVQRLFQRGCLQLQRLESIAKSPLFAHFSESLNGVSTIRAFGEHEHALATSCKLTDNLATAWVNLIDCHQWLTIRVTSLGTFIILATSVTAVLAAVPTAASAAATGLVISYSFSLTGVLQECVRSFTHSEQALVSVERVSEYGSMTQEGCDAACVKQEGLDAAGEQDTKTNKTATRLEADWPAEGKLVFENIVMTYRSHLPPALNKLSFETKGGEKIGIVGRTGAGKSSLAVALFRLAHNTSGTVRLDGVDVGQLELEVLRKQLSIIPQDPILFSGTIRSNLDPFLEKDDAAIWDALECVHMKELVAGYRSGLEHKVAQGGSNLSIGQRQLFCLARALLRRSKVIVMDEATASVDMETDNLIQDTIRTHFKASTVLTIAHRLNTVMCCDRVMVLSDGRMLEMGPPADLSNDPTSQFHAMVTDPKKKAEMLG